MRFTLLSATSKPAEEGALPHERILPKRSSSQSKLAEKVEKRGNRIWVSPASFLLLAATGAYLSDGVWLTTS